MGIIIRLIKGWLVLIVALVVSVIVCFYADQWIRLGYVVDSWKGSYFVAFCVVSLIQFITGVIVTGYMMANLELEIHPLHDTLEETSGFFFWSAVFWWLIWPLRLLGITLTSFVMMITHLFQRK